MSICTIDSNIWITGFDRKNIGYNNVNLWFRNNLDNFEKIILSMIIPLEVLHNLTKDPRVEFETPFSYVISLMSIRTVEIIEFGLDQFRGVGRLLARLRNKGIGGRDAVIIDSINEETTITSHDKNILTLEDYKRIDPFFSPPYELQVGEKFDNDEFSKRMKQM